MSALTRLERFDDLLPAMMRRMWNLPTLPAELPQDIRLDVTENDQAYTVKAEMPGARKEDIRVSVDGARLTIAAEVKHESEKTEGERVLMREMSSGSIARTIMLGHEIDEAEAQARFDNGVLELTLPKRREARGRRITVA
ncbi:MAG: Hsp20/alpha crystallin family protein [Rubrivivax sp.]|jgi:HSP20 family protein|nr:Hsp20/alpha crystallin family protein [Rubrivivax sp.]